VTDEQTIAERLAPSCQLVTTAADLSTVAAAIEESVVVGFDTETTGLNLRTDRIRLLTLDCDTDGGRFTYLIDVFAIDPSPLWEVLASKPIVIHNGTFDLAFLYRRGFTPEVVHDTRLLAQLLAAGTAEMYHCGLEDVVKQELGRDLDKTHLKSDWSGNLTEGQLRCAAENAAVLVPLYQYLSVKIKAAKLEQAAEIEQRLPTSSRLDGSGRRPV
jgi:DNA polymerase I